VATVRDVVKRFDRLHPWQVTVFSLSYAWNELRRRLGRTVVTAIGLAAGVGLVMGIIGVSQGLSDAQNKALSPLNSVGTDIIVTRTVAPRCPPQRPRPPRHPTDSAAARWIRRWWWRRWWRIRRWWRWILRRRRFLSELLGRRCARRGELLGDHRPRETRTGGTKFTHDFFVPGTLITFPSQAVTTVANVKGVKSAVGALSLDALHETGTVPKITASVKTGGQTISTSVKPPTLTAAEQATERTCIQAIITKQLGSTTTTIPSSGTGGGGGGGFGGAAEADSDSAPAPPLRSPSASRPRKRPTSRTSSSRAHGERSAQSADHQYLHVDLHRGRCRSH